MKHLLLIAALSIIGINAGYTQTKIADKTKPVKQTFTYVEQMPTYPGGPDSMKAFISKNLRYPAIAKQSGIDGRVIVRFSILANGSVDNATIIRGISRELDAEALRIVSIMPKWNPGYQNGKAVDVYYTMPIIFKLD